MTKPTEPPPKQLRSKTMDHLARQFGAEPDDPELMAAQKWQREWRAAGCPGLLPVDESEPD